MGIQTRIEGPFSMVDEDTLHVVFRNGNQLGKPRPFAYDDEKPKDCNSASGVGISRDCDSISGIQKPRDSNVVIG